MIKFFHKGTMLTQRNKSKKLNLKKNLSKNISQKLLSEQSSVIGRSAITHCKQTENKAST